MNQIKPAQETSDEIDLVALVQKLLLFLRRYGALILATAVIGSVAAFIWQTTKAPVYSSSVLLRPTLLSNSEQMQTVNNWSELLKSNETDELARLFGCSPATISKLHSITAENTSESPTNTSFSVTIEVSDTSIIKDMQHGILHAFESGDYMRDKLTGRRAAFEKMIEVTSREIRAYDSMRETIQKNLAGNGKILSPVIMDISEMNSTGVALNEKLLRLQDSLKFADAAYVLRSFHRPSGPDRIPTIIVLLAGAVVGALMGIVLSLLLILRKNLKASRS